MDGKFDNSIDSLIKQRKSITLAIDMFNIFNYIDKILGNNIDVSDFVTVSRDSMKEFLKLLKLDEYIGYVSYGSVAFYNYFLNVGNNDMLDLEVMTHKESPERNIGERASFRIRDYSTGKYKDSSELEYEFAFSTLYEGDFTIECKDRNTDIIAPNGAEITYPHYISARNYSKLDKHKFSEVIKEISLAELIERFRNLHPELAPYIDEYAKKENSQPKM